MSSSPSSRGRGLKYLFSFYSLILCRSPSSRGRGLKSLQFLCQSPYRLVALFTRAWIEIDSQRNIDRDRSVALFTRAWIEMHISNDTPLADGSPSSRGRGLKSHTEGDLYYRVASPSSRGRGLKYDYRKMTKKDEVALFTRAWIEIAPLVW